MKSEIKDLTFTEQIRRDILEKINRKVYPEGSKIPTEKELCEYYGVSRITVQNALLSLVNEGVLYRVKSKGTFVKKQVINWHFMTRDTSFDQQIMGMGMKPSTKVISFETLPADRQVAENLQINPGDLVIHLLRLRYADREPVAIVESFLPHDLCGHILDMDFSKKPLHETLNMLKRSRITRILRYVEAIPASNTEKMLLSVPKGSPIQFFTNYALNEDNRVVDYCLSYYRGDKSRFAVEILPARE